jgi:hypothetical protein
MTVNRERKMISAYTGNDIHLEYGTLKQAAECIQHLIEKYGEEAMILLRQEDYSNSEYQGVYVKRLETDQEMTRRIQEEEEWEALQARREAEDYARLKAKFEGK